MLDTGYSMLDTGCWLLVARYWLLDAGYSFLVTGFWLLVSALRLVESLGELLVSGRLVTVHRFWAQRSGLRIKKVLNIRSLFFDQTGRFFGWRRG
jgi:hypothetical protein